ncbi:MAG: hypothetical protein KC619_27245 [Myxococcales bacterium]|nr:hypothetical protein [Myxococcales bacterium]
MTNVYSSCQRRFLLDSYERGPGYEGRRRSVLLDPFGHRSARELQEDRWIEQMRSEQSGFCDALRRIPAAVATYNPFRDRSPYLRYASS